MRSRTIEAERHLRQYPEDVEAWIAYSTLHLKLSLELGNQPSGGMTDPAKLPQTRANAEVTLSILSSALDAHSRNMGSPTLHIAYIHAAEAFWAPEQVTERWKNVLREMGQRTGSGVEEGLMGVWLGYIEWREGEGFGKGADGGVDEVVDVYVDCLRDLRDSRRGGECGLRPSCGARLTGE